MINIGENIMSEALHALKTMFNSVEARIKMLNVDVGLYTDVQMDQ